MKNTAKKEAALERTINQIDEVSARISSMLVMLTGWSDRLLGSIPRDDDETISERQPGLMGSLQGSVNSLHDYVSALEGEVERLTSANIV